MTILTQKQALFSKYMFTAGSDTFDNGTDSARKAQYKGNDNVLAATASRLLRNVKIIAEKKRIQAKAEEISEVDREYLINATQTIAANSDNERNRLSALSLLGEFIGAKRESAPNKEREQAKRERMSNEDKKLAELAARLRTEEESRAEDGVEDSKPNITLSA